MRWQLITEQFSPKLTHAKGSHKAVADALSRMRLTEDGIAEEELKNDVGIQNPLAQELSNKLSQQNLLLQAGF